MVIFINQSEYISTAQRAGIKIIAQQANNAIFGDNMGTEFPAGYFASVSMRQVINKKNAFGSKIFEILRSNLRGLALRMGNVLILRLWIFHTITIVNFIRWTLVIEVVHKMR